MSNENYQLEEIQKNFSKNLKNLLNAEQMTQKELASKMDILESTVSKYNKKLPSCEFLIKLKNSFPNISIDDMLFGNFDEESKNTSQPHNSLLSEKLSKFTGVYYVYYLDTNRKKLVDEKRSLESQIRVGLIYIFDEIQPSPISKATCLAVFGLRKRSDAETIKKATSDMISSKEVKKYLRTEWGRYLYTGTFDVSQAHMFINTIQDSGNKDTALIIMHHTNFNNEKYIGGLGTINSTSSGRPSDPVVQVVAVSRKKVYLSDEELFSKLLFFKPTINMKSEAQEILALSQKLYERKAETTLENSSKNDWDVFEKHIPKIIESNMERLLENNIKRNTLWFGKISGDADQEWYEKLKQQNGLEED